jgi:hypothetical protein
MGYTKPIKGAATPAECVSHGTQMAGRLCNEMDQALVHAPLAYTLYTWVLSHKALTFLHRAKAANNESVHCTAASTTSPPMSSIRRVYGRSPPPHNHILERRHWPSGLPRALKISLVTLWDTTYRDMSLLHRVVVSQLLVTVVITELIRTHRPDPLLSAALEVVKIGLVADGIAALTRRLRCLSWSPRRLDWVLHKIGPSTEFAIIILGLRSENALMVQRFVLGSGYVKILAMGGLCLIVHAFRSRSQPVVDTWGANHAMIMWLLGISGLCVLASAPHIESKSAND